MSRRKAKGLVRRFFLCGVMLLALEGAVHAETDVPRPRIIGGDETYPDQWPWVAALVDAGQPSPMAGQYCGGTLIHPDWVLTAAHCADDRGHEIDVVLGTHDLTAPPDAYERIPVSRIVIHPNYRAVTFENDIALLELSRPSLQTPIPSLLTPATDFVLAFPGDPATVVGWGDTDISPIKATYPARLMEVDVPIISNPQCRRSYGSKVTDAMICAGYTEGGKDACSGDSGGPLMVPDGRGGYSLAGIVSWGSGCALARYYGVYTRVSHFIPWILSRVDLEINCGDYDGDGVRDVDDFYAIAHDIWDAYFSWGIHCWWAWDVCGDYNGDGRLTDDDWQLAWEDLTKGFWLWFYDCSGID